MTAWDDAHARAETRWASMEDAEITLPARLVAEHGREHAALLRAVRVRVERGHNDTCDWALIQGYKCNCGHDALLAALDEIRNKP